MRGIKGRAKGVGWAGLLFVLSCSIPSLAQGPAPTANLALAVTPGRLFHGLPLAFTVSLTNITTHIVRLPEPASQCGAVPLGTLSFHIGFTPLPPAAASTRGQGCIEDFVHSRESILAQIASWNVLLPGASLSFPMALHKVIASPPPPGTYTVSARYVPPFLPPSEHEALTLRAIDTPRAELSNVALVYRVGSHISPTKGRR